MNLANVPSKAEVMGWDPQTLADYMWKLKLSGCDRVVMKGSISGANFMEMTEFDLQVFPCLYLPIITKIQTEMNKGERKKTPSHKSKAHKYPKQVFVQEKEGWEFDEFDNVSDDSDYEDAEQEAGKKDYIYSVDKHQDSEKTNDSNSRLPAAKDIVKPPRPPRADKLQDCHRDPVPDPTRTKRMPRTPVPPAPKGNYVPQRPLKVPASQPGLHIDRSKKFAEPRPSQIDIPKLKGSVVKPPDNKPPPCIPKSTDMCNRTSKLIPDSLVPAEATEGNISITGERKGLDLSWYGGKITRHQAEVALREVNKDGAFVVRDSSKGSVEHPFTLMLLYQGRVYNIKIRNQGSTYSLGSGLRNTKTYPGVKELITHHAYTPLLLIDATDQCPDEQPQCCLLHPAGL